MADDIIHALEHLAGLSEAIHWFCPRVGADDDSVWYDEDQPVQSKAPISFPLGPAGGATAVIDSKSKSTTTSAIPPSSTHTHPPEPQVDQPLPPAEAKLQSKLQATADLKSLFLTAIQILAFSGPDAIEYQRFITTRLAGQLSWCDVCVREYHRLRPVLAARLEAEHDSDDVRAFMATFDTMNRDRMQEGLEKVRQQLEATEPARRGMAAVGMGGMFALFEVLSSAQVLEDETFLETWFDRPFKLVQENRVLKLTGLAPGVFFFLLSSSRTGGEERIKGRQARYEWAYLTLQRVKSPISLAQFEHNIRRPLERALAALSRESVARFWDSLRLVMSKIQPTIVGEVIGQVQPDLVRVVLDQMPADNDALPDLLQTFEGMVRNAPAAVWASLEGIGAVRPAGIVDLVCGNAGFSRPFCDRRPLTESGTGLNPEVIDLVNDEDGNDLADDSGTDWMRQVSSWIPPFLESVRPLPRVVTARAVVRQLLGPGKSRQGAAYAFRLAVQVVDDTIGGLLNGGIPLGAATGEVLELMVDVMPGVVSTLQSGLGSAATLSRCTRLIGRAAEADCGRVRDELAGASLDSRATEAAAKLWRILAAAVQGSGRGRGPYGGAAIGLLVLAGCVAAVGLEELVLDGRIDGATRAVREKSNGSFRSLMAGIRAVLDALADRITPADIVNPIGATETTAGSDCRVLLFRPLFFGAFDVRVAAVEAIKGAGGSEGAGRRESLKSLAAGDLPAMCRAMTVVLDGLVVGRAYAASAAAVRVCVDVADALWGDDGLVADVSGPVPDVGGLWTGMWHFLAHVFGRTEKWADDGHDRAELVDFCRGTMQFAGELFGRYSVVRMAAGDQPDSESGSDELLAAAELTMAPMVRWLRLRDDYLSITIVELVVSLLSRFGSAGIPVQSGTVGYIRDVVAGRVKTKLSTGQLAELRRAVGEPESASNEGAGSVVRMKQASLSGWLDRAAGVGGSTRSLGDGHGSSGKLSDRTSQRSTNTSASTSSLSSGVNDGTNRLRSLLLRGEPEKAKSDEAAAEFRRKRAADLEAKKARDKAAALKARAALRDGLANAGTGLRGLGVLGKEHRTKGEGMMVSSESEGSADELDMELFGLVEPGRPGRKTESGSAGVPVPVGPVRKRRHIRSARDVRARLSPDLSALHKAILGWDVGLGGAYPPGARQDTYEKVPAVFSSVAEYQRVFERLLLLEAWQALVRAKEELGRGRDDSFTINLTGRTTVDGFFELAGAVNADQAEDVRLSEGDLVMLTLQSEGADGQDGRTVRAIGGVEPSPNCLGRLFRTIRKKGRTEVVLKVGSTGNRLAVSLVPGTSVSAVKLQTLTTVEREYGALVGLPYYDLCDEIVRAKPAPMLEYSADSIAAITKTYSLNTAQAKAVRGVVENDSFSLVQGPPGSGKTKTITAMVGALLSHPSSGTAPKLLVCAPSNAAVDELVIRLKKGVRSLDGTDRPLSVVRLGRSEVVDPAVADVMLDELVRREMSRAATVGAAGGGMSTTGSAASLSAGKPGTAGTESVAGLMREHQTVSQRLREARVAVDAATGEEAARLTSDVSALRSSQQSLSVRIDQARDAEAAKARVSELARRKAQQAVLSRADVLCATLSGAGHDMFHSLAVEFAAVIVDEAAQCVEVSALIPLKYGTAKAVLVGDPNQLPPTVFSKEAARFSYEQSLFVRLQKADPKAVHLLDTQYRMHPAISAFPSTAFYQGRLKDGPGLAVERSRPWHRSSVLGPYVFFDIRGQHASAAGHSLINVAEADAAVTLYRTLIGLSRYWPEFDLNGQVGIITPYKAQLRELKNRFSRAFGHEVLQSVEFNTTDAYQGRESEIIIFSCVRASDSGGLGFVQDIRRMNVGLTRAKASLWVVGNADVLRRGEYWARLVDDAKQRGVLEDGLSRLSTIKPEKRIRECVEEGEGGRADRVDGRAEKVRRMEGDDRRDDKPGKKDDRELVGEPPTGGRSKAAHEKQRQDRADKKDRRGGMGAAGAAGATKTTVLPRPIVVLTDGGSAPASGPGSASTSGSTSGPGSATSAPTSATSAPTSAPSAPTSGSGRGPPTAPASMRSASTAPSTTSSRPGQGRSKAVKLTNRPRVLPGFTAVRAEPAGTVSQTSMASTASAASAASPVSTVSEAATSGGFGFPAGPPAGPMVAARRKRGANVLMQPRRR